MMTRSDRGRGGGRGGGVRIRTMFETVKVWDCRAFVCVCVCACVLHVCLCVNMHIF
jgi:hypothetical protein